MPWPSTPMLDDFSRPDENPLSGGGRWTFADNSLTGHTEVVNQQATWGGVGDNAIYAYDATGPVFTATEVWVRVGGVPGTIQPHLYVRMNDIGGTLSLDGYRAIFAGSLVQLSRITDAASVNLGSRSIASTVAGDVLILRALGPSLTAYRIRDGVLEQLFSASDTTYPSGRIGIGMTSTETATATQFGGGVIDSLVPGAHPVAGFGAA